MPLPQDIVPRLKIRKNPSFRDISDNFPKISDPFFFYLFYPMYGRKKGDRNESITFYWHILLFSVFMCEQMILTVLIISFAFRTETELQIFSVLFGTATDRAAMMSIIL